MANVNFSCTTGSSQHVRYQCTVIEGFSMGWRIEDGNDNHNESEYAEGNNLNTSRKVYISGDPDFTTTLSSNTPPLKSDISFTAQASLIGYTVECFDVHNNNRECKLQGKSICMQLYLNIHI